MRRGPRGARARGGGTRAAPPRRGGRHTRRLGIPTTSSRSTRLGIPIDLYSIYLIDRDHTLVLMSGPLFVSAGFFLWGGLVTLDAVTSRPCRDPS